MQILSIWIWGILKVLNFKILFYIFRHRLPKKQWWLNLRPLVRILGKHEAMYCSEILDTSGVVNDLLIEDRDENELDAENDS